jgi:CRISPR-associated endonuclease Cas2
MKYIIIYDMPREKKVLHVQVNRKLHAIRAERLQHSIWESEVLENLKEIAAFIRAAGGEASVLEKKIVF